MNPHNPATHTSRLERPTGYEGVQDFGGVQ